MQNKTNVRRWQCQKPGSWKLLVAFLYKLCHHQKNVGYAIDEPFVTKIGNLKEQSNGYASASIPKAEDKIFLQRAIEKTRESHSLRAFAAQTFKAKVAKTLKREGESAGKQQLYGNHSPVP